MGLEAISNFLMNHPRKSPTRDGKMQQGLGKTNKSLNNLESRLAAGEDLSEEDMVLLEELREKMKEQA